MSVDDTNGDMPLQDVERPWLRFTRLNGWVLREPVARIIQAHSGRYSEKAVMRLCWELTGSELMSENRLAQILGLATSTHVWRAKHEDYVSPALKQALIDCGIFEADRRPRICFEDWGNGRVNDWINETARRCGDTRAELLYLALVCFAGHHELEAPPGFFFEWEENDER